jgi:hypothetical protein
MVDLFFPDRSQFQGHKVVASHLVCARSSEGNWLADPDYGWNVTHARQAGILQAAYHFLEDGSSAGSQANWAHAIAGKAPMMLDLEPIVGLGAIATDVAPGAVAGPTGHFCGQSFTDLQQWAYAGGHGQAAVDAAAAAPYISRPGVALALAFVDAYRAAGGIIHDVYLPRWYWEVLGRPSLTGFADRRMILTSSNYVAYSDSGPGWAPYGGMTPRVWQYTSTGPGAMDWNAYRTAAASIGAAVSELWSLLNTGTAATMKRQLRKVAANRGQTLHGLVAAHPGNGVAGAWEHTIAKAPADLLSSHALRAYMNAGDWDAPLWDGAVFWLWV